VDLGKPKKVPEQSIQYQAADDKEGVLLNLSFADDLALAELRVTTAQGRAEVQLHALQNSATCKGCVLTAQKA
jgi:hypothetical protein